MANRPSGRVAFADLGHAYFNQETQRTPSLIAEQLAPPTTDSGTKPVYNKIFKWIEDNSYQPAGVYHECCYNSPDEVPESHLLTRIVIPLKYHYKKHLRQAT